MTKDFHMELLNNNSIMIIILSTELTSAYWNELKQAVYKLNLSNVDIYFDFLYRNGFENRFFHAKLNEKSMLEGRLRSCNLSEKYKQIANMFFQSHIDVLNGSALSNAHRNQFIRMLRDM